jgi:hypothetical protein
MESITREEVHYVFFSKYYYGDQVNMNKMDERRDDENACILSSGNLMGRNCQGTEFNYFQDML